MTRDDPLDGPSARASASARSGRLEGHIEKASTRRKLASVIDDQSALSGFSRVRVSMTLTDPRAEDNPIVYVNSAFERMTGYNRSSVIGRNCRFLQGEGTRKADVDRLRAAIAEERDVTVDITNYRADGQPFVNRLIIAPISDADGQVIYFLGMQKELTDSEGEKDSSGSLLAALRSRVQADLGLLLDGLADRDGDEQVDYDAMNRRLECLQLVYEGMKLSDRQHRNRHGIDLGSLVSRIAAAVAHEEGRPGIRYVQHVEPMTVNLDAAVRVSILASEVLSNAFAHAFERMEEWVVELRMSQLAAGGLRMTVTDDGVGIPGNAPFPNPNTVGGRLVKRLVDGLDASITPVCGAAGTVVLIDVPFSATDL
jgi:PAS domain S-box-containing protein